MSSKIDSLPWTVGEMREPFRMVQSIVIRCGPGVNDTIAFIPASKPECRKHAELIVAAVNSYGTPAAGADVAGLVESLAVACEALLAVYAPMYHPTEITDAFSSAVMKARTALDAHRNKGA